MKDLIEIDKVIVNDLNSLVKEVNKVHQDVLISKTAGVVAGTVGTVAGIAGILLAPVTAGFSFGLTVAGATLVGSGAVINIGAIIGDTLRSKGFLEKIQSLTKQHDEQSRKFSSITEDIRYIVRILQDNHDMDENSAIWATLGTKVSKANGEIKDLFDARKAIKIANAVKALKSTGSVINVGAAGQFSFTIGKPLAAMTKTEMTGIIQIIKTPSSVAKASASVGKTVFKAVTSAATVVLTIWEIKDLVNEWNAENPTIEIISSLIENLKSEQKSLELLLL